MKLGAAVLACAALLAQAGPALACSCAELDPRERLGDGDVAFIGRVAAKRALGGSRSFDERYEYTLAVERDFNADLGPELTISSITSGATCGFEWEPGQRVAAFLYRQGGEWSTSLCSLVSPAELVRATVPYPTPLGQGRMRVLVGGEYGSARVMALDDDGILAYGRGRGSVEALARCPGGRRVAELVSGPRGTRVAIRSLRTLDVLRSRGVDRDTIALSCADAAGDRLYAATLSYARRRPWSRVRIDALRARSAERVATVAGEIVELRRGRAFVAGPSRVRAIDLDSGRVRSLARIERPVSIASSPDGRSLAVLGERSLRVLSRRSVVGMDVPGSAALSWLDSGRLLLAGYRAVRVLDAGTLRQTSRHRLGGYLFASTPSQVFALERYRLRRLDLASGAVTELPALPDPDTRALLAFARPPQLEPVWRGTPAAVASATRSDCARRR